MSPKRGGPERIVTLLPSATEIVCGLGLGDRLAGVSHECDFPAFVKGLPAVTRSLIPAGLSSRAIDRAVRRHLERERALYTLDLPLLQRLQPDLIVTQALCDVCAVSGSEVAVAVASLEPKPALVNLEPMSLAEVFDTIHLVAGAAGCPERAEEYVGRLRMRVEKVKRQTCGINRNLRPRVAFLEWIDPPFNAGHWIPELIDYAGGIDCLGNVHAPSRTITREELESSRPDVLVIALCGFDEIRARQDLEILKRCVNWSALPCVRQGRVYTLDGNAFFSRPGPRLVDALEILANLLHGRRNAITGQ